MKPSKSPKFTPGSMGSDISFVPQAFLKIIVNGEASDTVIWEDILRFNWDCIIATADRALSQGIDVLIDYVFAAGEHRTYL